jgi:hypothetical protein
MKKQFDDTYITEDDDLIKEIKELYILLSMTNLNNIDKTYIESMYIYINNNKKYRSKIIHNYLDVLRKLSE